MPCTAPLPAALHRLPSPLTLAHMIGGCAVRCMSRMHAGVDVSGRRENCGVAVMAVKRMNAGAGRSGQGCGVLRRRVGM